MAEGKGPLLFSRRGLAVAIAACAFLPQTLHAQTGVPRSLGRSTSIVVAYASEEKAGAVIVDTRSHALYLILSATQARRYTISVGRDGFRWSGTVKVGAKKEWPYWTPPAEMRQRDPTLPESVPPGPLNPLGARAIYLHRGGVDTLFRIHGTNDADAIGDNQTSGCFRLTNKDVIDIYQRVEIGAKVIVLD